MHQLNLYRFIWQNLGRYALLLCSLLLASAATAQTSDYPNKPIRFIVAFPAGSATDQAARLVAHQMTKATGQSIVVDNRGGANGFIASVAVAKAPADGYTVLLTTGSTHAANPSLFKKLPYDPVKDFAPVTSLSNNAFVLVVAPNFPANSVADLAKLAKASPGKYSFASGNAPSRVGGEMFKMMAGLSLAQAPKRLFSGASTMVATSRKRRGLPRT